MKGDSMNSDLLTKPQRLSRSEIYSCPWVTLYVDKVLLPNGHIIEKYHIIDFGTPAVGVIVENELGKVLLVQVYRYPTDSVNWEIPAGRCEKGETVIEAGMREVLEESGYNSTGHQLLTSFNPINGISNETFYILKCEASNLAGEFDTDEIAAVRWCSRNEIEGMLVNNEFRDGFTLTAMLLWLRGKDENSILV